MTRQTVFIAAVLLMVPASAMAQDYDDWDYGGEVEVFESEVSLGIEAYLMVSQDDGPRPELGLTVAYPLSEDGGLWLFAGGTTWYAQTYGGFMLTPAEWLMFGFGTGLETFGSHWRIAVVLDINTHGFHLAGVFETGASGRWHHVRATYQIGDHFLFGLMSQRGEGEGLIVGAAVNFVEVRMAYLYDIEMYVTEGRDSGMSWRDNRFFTLMFTIGINILPLPE